jgi:DNA-binding HxlR family transcriptional regulator
MTYSISEYGMTLAPVLASLCDWGRKHMQRNGVGVTPAAD